MDFKALFEEKKMRIVELAVAILAFIISVTAMILSQKNSRDTTRIATEALTVAHQANEISLGRVHEQPQIEIYDFPKSVTLISIPDLSREQEGVSLMNVGKIPVSGIEILLIGVPGLIYRLANPDETYKEMPTQTSKIEFDQQLAPTALAHISLKPAVVKFLGTNGIVLKSPDEKYRMTINIVIIPQRTGENQPVQQEGGKDRELMNVDFIPTLLKGKEASEMATTMPKVMIYPPHH
jgi:hypothetical protein